MRILTRYILLDLLQVFFVTLTSMTLFVFLMLIGKEAVENGLGVGPILKMLPYVLPQAMQFAVPGALLMAATSVFGRVASANEIVAIKSLGISPMKVVSPMIALACGISLVAVMLNDVAVSWGDGGVQRVVLESLEEIIYGRLRTTRTYGNDRLKITIRAVDGDRLIQPTILYYSKSNQPPTTVTADEAKISVDPDASVISMAFLNVDVDFSGQGRGTASGWQTLPFSIDQFTGHGSGQKSPSNYALREIGPSKVQQSKQIESLERSMAAEVGFALLTGQTEQLSQYRWQPRVDELNSAVRRLHRLQTEPHRRWANGFSCLSFALIGAPMAIRRRHGEFWGSFFACFLPILLVYYPMLVGCVDQAKDGVLPPSSVWLGNIVLAIWGGLLLRRVIRN